MNEDTASPVEEAGVMYPTVRKIMGEAARTDNRYGKGALELMEVARALEGESRKDQEVIREALRDELGIDTTTVKRGSTQRNSKWDAVYNVLRLAQNLLDVGFEHDEDTAMAFTTDQNGERVVTPIEHMGKALLWSFINDKRADKDAVDNSNIEENKPGEAVPAEKLDSGKPSAPSAATAGADGRSDAKQSEQTLKLTPDMVIKEATRILNDELVVIDGQPKLRGVTDEQLSIEFFMAIAQAAEGLKELTLENEKAAEYAEEDEKVEAVA